VENQTKNETIVNSDSNPVVIYFSATGTTKNIAEKISNKLNSDCRANGEQNDKNSRPEIENTIDITKYDTIYLGYPIWWGTNPKIILTLLDTYDFSNKTIIPFCTSGSSGIGTSVKELRNYNSKLSIKDGKRFSSNASDKDISEFIENN
jgi:flavodoxin